MASINILHIEAPELFLILIVLIMFLEDYSLISASLLLEYRNAQNAKHFTVQLRQGLKKDVILAMRTYFSQACLDVI